MTDQHLKDYDKFGVPNSVYPPTDYMTFGYWIYMVPQYKPKSVLMLGYAGGTTAGLIRLVYGDVPITGVDIEDCVDRYGVNLVKADAKEFVKTCGHYDAVLVDLFPNDSHLPCNFVTDKEFVSNLARIGDYIIVNTYEDLDMSAYKIMEQVESLYVRGNRIYYFQTVKHEGLFPA